MEKNESSLKRGNENLKSILYQAASCNQLGNWDVRN